MRGVVKLEDNITHPLHSLQLVYVTKSMIKKGYHVLRKFLFQDRYALNRMF